MTGRRVPSRPRGTVSERPSRHGHPATGLTRTVWLLTFAAAVIAGLAARGLFDGPIGARGGEIAYAVALYALLNASRPQLPVAATANAFAGCLVIETFQLTGVPAALGAWSPAFWLFLGSRFSGQDIRSYLFGAVLAGVAHQLICRWRETHHHSTAAGL